MGHHYTPCVYQVPYCLNCQTRRNLEWMTVTYLSKDTSFSSRELSSVCRRRKNPLLPKSSQQSTGCQNMTRMNLKFHHYSVICHSVVRNNHWLYLLIGEIQLLLWLQTPSPSLLHAAGFLGSCWELLRNHSSVCPSGSFAASGDHRAKGDRW